MLEVPILSSEETSRARETAHALFEKRGYRGVEIFRTLAAKSDFNKVVLHFYLQLFDFRGIPIVKALRVLFSRFTFEGEAQEKDRIMEGFSERYAELNALDFSADALHHLLDAILFLNSNLHTKIKDVPRVTLKSFQRNLAGLCDGGDFPIDLLKSVYLDIQSNEIVTDSSSREPVQDHRGGSNTNVLHSMKRRRPTEKLALLYRGEPLGRKAIDGILTRKDLTDERGDRCTKLQRRWHSFYVTLVGSYLIFHNPQDRPYTRQEFTSNMHDIVLLRHCYARTALEYAKRDCVFALCLATGQRMLLQASDDHKMDAWIQHINSVAALESAPPLPAPVCSARSGFMRPTFPESRSQESLEEKLERNNSHLVKLNRDLAAHQEAKTALYDNGDKASRKFWLKKQEYLEWDRDKTSVYLRILEQVATPFEMNSSSAGQSPLGDASFSSKASSAFVQGVTLSGEPPSFTASWV